MKPIASIICTLVTLFAVVQETHAQDKKFVPGGQFKDLFLPIPIVGDLESENIWGDDTIVPRDVQNGIEYQGEAGVRWRYWGGSLIKSADGKYHMAVARWPMGGDWRVDSQVVRCVSKTPTGPYRVEEMILEDGHNPELLQLKDGGFLLHTIQGVCQLADKLEGPWAPSERKMVFKSRNFNRDDKIGSNLTTEYRPDGSLLLLKKNGDIAISNSGPFGPYLMVSAMNYYRATGYPEDPVVWRSAHQYHAVYNHEQDRKNAYMRSLDGIHWINETGTAYGHVTRYTDGTENYWSQLERPKVLQDQLGRATHMSFAVHDEPKNGSKTIVVPLTTEKMISIVGDQSIAADADTIKLRIRAEDGFRPAIDMDIPTLRLGSSSVVNYGGGCKATRSYQDGEDLIVVFQGDTGTNRRDYDLKLLGRTKSGDLTFGYALLPGKSATAASLIVLPPTIDIVDGKRTFQCVVENAGLEESTPQTAVVYQYSATGRQAIHEFPVAPLKPYKNAVISIPWEEQVGDKNEYEVIILGSDRDHWQMVNDLDDSVEFTGAWESRDVPDESCWMKSEQISTTAGDSVKFTFHGTRARAHGRLGREMGAFAVYVDGKYVETVNSNYAPKVHVKIYQTELLPEGKHILELKKTTGKFNGEVAIDSFSYESALQPTP